MTDFSMLSDYIIGIRRTLHKHPELSGQEFQTQQLIRSELDKLGIPHRTLHETDILAEIAVCRRARGKPLTYRLKSTVKQFCCAPIWMPFLLRKIQTRLCFTVSRRHACLRTRLPYGHAAGGGKASLGQP